MKIIKYPAPENWSNLIQRPALNASQLQERVQDIMETVRQKKDAGIRQLTQAIDGVNLENFKVTEAEINEASKAISEELKSAIQIAKRNITRFHREQIQQKNIIETMPGVQCWRQQVPIEKVGLYIPGGSAPLFSSLLMLGIPAQLAACPEIIVCTPPGKDGNISPVILYTANLLNIKNIFKIGGAQAIAAMTYGTESVPKVDKLFGPGNQYVTEAKEQAQRAGTVIDMPAGPSEVLVIADESSHPAFVAADLLSQAEHGADSQVILVTDSERILEGVLKEIRIQIKKLPREAVAEKALENSKAILLPSLETCLQFSNQYAPEHLIIATQEPLSLAQNVRNAGSVFLGQFTCESAGDYASGTNHTLPTNQYARQYSGVSLDSFVKQITFQQISKTGIQNIGPAIEVMAEAEGLQAHKNAVSIRLAAIKNEKNV